MHRIIRYIRRWIEVGSPEWGNGIGWMKGVEEVGFCVCIYYRIIYSLWNSIVFKLLFEVYNHQTQFSKEHTLHYHYDALNSAHFRCETEWSYKLLMDLCSKEASCIGQTHRIHLILVYHVSFNIWWICRIIRLYRYWPSLSLSVCSNNWKFDWQRVH